MSTTGYWIHYFMKRCAICVCILSCTRMLTAQDTLRFTADSEKDTIAKIELLAMYEADMVRLRWAPNTAAEWNSLLRFGYRVEKYTLDQQHLPVMNTRKEWIIRPWEKEKFRPFIQSDKEKLLIAAQCMYGDYETGTKKQPHLFARADELTNRFGLALLAADLDWEAALSLGLALEDKDVIAENNYLYIVHPGDTSVHTGIGFTSIQCTASLIPAPVIQHIIEHEGTVTIQWNRHDHEPYFSAYHIERSADGKNYSRLLDIPFVGGVTKDYPSPYFSYTDTVQNYIPYQYRIVGVTPFATTSSPSPVRSGMGRDKTPPPAIQNIDIVCDAEKRNVTITWTIDDNADPSTFLIFRSDRMEGPWQDVTKSDLNRSRLAFSENCTDAYTLHYYQIAAKDSAGNARYSLPLLAAFRDTISPAMPLGLHGSIDSFGIVSLKWKRGKEADLRGYYVYKSNQPDHFYTNVTPRPIADTVWTDTITLKTFTERMYYRVAAVDFHSHFSSFSAPLEIQKPDTIRPFAPHFTSWRVENDFILLTTRPSESKDVVQHELWRKFENEDWVRLPSFSIRDSLYRDREIRHGVTYHYKLLAIDDAGLVCRYPEEIRIKAVDLSTPEPPIIASCAYTADGAVHIAWSATETSHFQLYRAVDGSPFVTIAQVSDASEYIDASVRSTATYQYKIRSIRPDGKKSGFSAIATPTR